jgi:hypothetical protein
MGCAGQHTSGCVPTVHGAYCIRVNEQYLYNARTWRGWGHYAVRLGLGKVFELKATGRLQSYCTHAKNVENVPMKCGGSEQTVTKAQQDVRAACWVWVELQGSARK